MDTLLFKRRLSVAILLQLFLGLILINGKGYAQDFASNLIMEHTVSFDKTVDMITNKDFEALQLSGSVRVFGLGEANHGSKEFQILKEKLASYLIDKLGVNTILIEYPYSPSESILLDQYVKGLNPNGLKKITDAKGHEYNNAEFLDFVNFIKQLNESRNPEKQINFLGADVFGKPKDVTRDVVATINENPNNKILIIAHIKHIGNWFKDSGHLLREKLGDQYFPIGTDYEEGEFSLWNLSTPNKMVIDTVYAPKSTNSFASKFSEFNGQFHFISFAELTGKEREWIQAKNDIAFAGLGYRTTLKPEDFRIPAVLDGAFDAMFIFKKISPSSRY